MDWLINNWEICFSFAVALAIMWMVFFKQEFESMKERAKADSETGKQNNPKKNMSKKKKAGGGTVTPTSTTKEEKSPKDSS